MSVTLSTIRTQVRSYLDESTPADWTNTELDKLINQRYHRVISFVMTTYEDYYVTTDTFNITAAQEEYGISDGLPSDIFKLRRVEVTYNSTDANAAPTHVLPLVSMDAVNRDLGFRNAGLGLTVYTNSYYYTRGFGSAFKIGIIPIPNISGTNAGQIWYVQQQSDLSSDSDTINIPYPERYWHSIAEGAVADAFRFGVQESIEADKWDAKFDASVALMQQELEDKNADDYKAIIDVQGEILDFTSI